MIEIPALVAYALAMAASCIAGLISSWWGNRKRELPEEVKVPLSETDMQYASDTRDMIIKHFGENTTETFRAMTQDERIDALHNFTEELAVLYGIDVEIKVFSDKETGTWGYYNYQDNTINLNVAYMEDTSVENYEYYVHETIDTVVHELRHAVQYRAAQGEDIWDIDDERKIEWANNFINYISSTTDYRGYRTQPVEADAVTFAAEAMRGVN